VTIVPDKEHDMLGYANIAVWHRWAQRQSGIRGAILGNVPAHLDGSVLDVPFHSKSLKER
jgi:hypothetical protein